MGSIYNQQLFNLLDLSGSFGVTDLNGSTLKAAAIFRARGQQITKIGVNFSSVTAPPVMLVDLQSVVAAVPSTTILGGGSPASATFTPAAGWQWVTLTNPYTPAFGDVLAAVVEYSSGTIDASHHGVLNLRLGSGKIDLPVPLTFNGTTWSNNATQFPCIAVQYSDGSVAQYMCALTSSSFIDYANSATPNEYGLFFVAPGNMTIDSLMVGLKPGGTFSGTLTLYDGTSTSLIGTDNVTITQNETFGGGSINLSIAPITPVTLTQGSSYYLGWKALTANTIRVMKLTFPDIASKRAMFGDTSLVSRKDSGAWTQDDNSIAWMSPIVSGISAAAATYVLNSVRNLYLPEDY